MSTQPNVNAADGARGAWLSDAVRLGPFAQASTGGRLGQATSYGFDLGAASAFAAGEPRRGNAETRSIEREGTGVYAARARFADDGSYLYLQRFDRGGHRGELVLDGTVIGGGVPDGFQITADASRVLFRTDALTVREPNVIALWEDKFPDGGGS